MRSSTPGSSSAEGPDRGALGQRAPARGVWGRLRPHRGMLTRDRAAVVAALVLAALVIGSVLVPWLSAHRYDRTDLTLGATPPSWAHWMGTDEQGRDLLTRVFFGARISFGAAAIGALVSAGIGIGWGGVAGYAGGMVDAVMMRVVEALQAFPRVVFVILVMVFFAGERTALHRAFRAVLRAVGARPDDPFHATTFQVVVVFAALGAISWLAVARVVRAEVATLRQQPFVEAARALGAGHAAILTRHLLPNAIGPVIALAALTIPELMVVEAFLSLLGLGTQEPLASWGLLLGQGAETIDLHPWQVAFPAAMLAITLLCFAALGRALGVAWGPRIGAPEAR
jgi:oligopeptide transport system permease protein